VIDVVVNDSIRIVATRLGSSQSRSVMEGRNEYGDESEGAGQEGIKLEQRGTGRDGGIVVR
jgi:hypothetical protein